jgi:N-acetylmuramoyl-L-alanine amidase
MKFRGSFSRVPSVLSLGRTGVEDSSNGQNGSSAGGIAERAVMTRREVLRRSGGLALAGLGSWASGGSSGLFASQMQNVVPVQVAMQQIATPIWSPVRYAGRDYLPLEQVGRFYGMGALQRSGRECQLGFGERTLRGAAESTDFFISRVKCVLSYPLAEVGSSVCISRLDLVKLVEPVLRPFKIEGAERVESVVLDAGHGGVDRGAVGRLGDEKTFTLDVVLRAGQLLGRAGYRVVFTRAGDDYVSLEERVQVANRASRALFVSVHFNSGGSGSGVETYALSPKGVPSMSSEGLRVPDFGDYPGNLRDAENAAWATAAHSSLVARCGMMDRGIKRARFYVIREATIPSILIEAGFLSNDDDMRRIASPWYRQQLAGVILEAVKNYRRAVGGAPV